MTIIMLATALLTQTGDAATARKPQAELIGDMAAIFGPEHYPPAAIRAHEEGLVVADLTIDTLGRVTDCEIIESAASSLSEQTCRLSVINRGLFRAARDRDGKAVVGHY